MEKLLEMDELAGLLGISTRTLKNWIWADKHCIKTYMFKVGAAWKIDEKGFQGLIESMRGSE